jgi:hypothetical protein
MPKTSTPGEEEASSLLELLLGTKLVGVSALSLTAVGGTGREAGVALAADHLVLQTSRKYLLCPSKTQVLK